ncbi:hypothetical protein EV401DRAFT_2070496 [Pisolithus croceorrhizus]|nr:hypothetical protein EV401DRAFT_2070496 [Pisolithus croceorrhizus]
MSSLGSESVSIGVSAFHQYLEVQFAMITLMVYDHAITLGKEYDLFWRGPLSLSKVLYLLVRLDFSIIWRKYYASRSRRSG